MFQSFALCAYRGPAASSAAALITVPIVSEIQRIVHPPCDVVIRVMHQEPKASPLRGANPCLGKISGSVSRHQQVASSLIARQPHKPAKKREPSLNAARALEAGNRAILCPRQLASIAICNGFSRFYRCDLPQKCAKIITCHLTGRLARYFGLRQMLVVAFSWLCMQRSEVSNGPVPCCGNLDIVHFRFISKPLIGS